MVYLNKIYTKSGDSGETALGDGTRVPKTHLRIGAYGGVDELNAALGVAIACGSLSEKMAALLTIIQNDLFDVGADLCVPESEEPREYEPLRVTQLQIDQLEKWIDEKTENLSPLNSFILPGGNPAAAHLHMARTICRRAEIGVIALTELETVNPCVVMYLNRLSDLLFVLARAANNQGEADILWKPGGERSVD